MCGAPHEFFNETSLPFYNRTIGATTFNKYFLGIVRNHSFGGRFGFKINVDRFDNLKSIIDLKSLLPRKAPTYFWMTREDIIAQAFSFARAKKTGHWHDYTTHSVGQPSDTLKLAYADLWREVLLIVRQERAFLDFARESDISPIALNYEQMVSDKKMLALRVMTALGCDAKDAGKFILTMEDKTKRLDPGDKYQLLVDFFEVYGAGIVDLFRQRTNPDEKQLRKMLMDRYNLRI